MNLFFKTPTKKKTDFLIWKDRCGMITAAWTSHHMSTLTTPSSCSSFLRLKKKKHSNGIRTGLNFECSNASNAISNAVPRKNAFHSYEECNSFETRNTFKYGSQKPRNGIRTFEWKMADHSNAFECLFLGPVDSASAST